MLKKPYVIAEMAQSFEGDPQLVRKLIKTAKKSGADAVKFQIFKPSELCTEDYEYYSLFQDLMISERDRVELIKYCQEISIDFMADIFGLETYSWLVKNKVAAIKIHSTDIKNYPLLRGIKGFHGKIALSAGGSSLAELDKAIEILKGCDLVLMPGFQAEPNLFSDVELNKIEFLKNRYDIPVGYADHLDASEKMAVVLPAMAFLKGADYIEKHLTIERETLELEDSISDLNPGEFKEMLYYIDGVSKFAHTSDSFKLSEREEAYRLRSKKVPVAASELKEGHKLKIEDMALVRVGVRPDEVLDLEELEGKVIAKGLGYFEPITRGCLK
ncbi:MAG: N-acetylneuraminate synthase family protein [Bdellovibrionales bacterium]|nr:N-acetylneuraminate synthase family protein [Bdellovibrionales bacterium]